MFLGLTTLLPTMLVRVFTFAGLVASLSTSVRPTSQHLSTDQSAKAIAAPARLILESLLATKTILLGQEWTLWAILIIHMAVVSHRGMATCRWTSTRKRTRWWTGTTW